VPADPTPVPSGETDLQAALAAATQAEERAAVARARATTLRQHAESVRVDTEDPVTGRRSRLAPALTTLAVLTLCALLAASGYLLWQHRQADQQRQLSAEYAAAARQGVVNLMSLNFNSAKEDVQRVLDNATGKFKENFDAESGFLVKALQESEVVTEVTVNQVAVESKSDDSAVVLVSSESQATNSKNQRQQPQFFRIAVALARDGGQVKVAQVDFL